MNRDDPFPEGNDEVLSKGPCPKCSSSDGFAAYRDGHGYCFVCGHRAKSASPSRPPAKPSATKSGLLIPGDFKDLEGPLKARGLDAQTIRKYGYFLARMKGEVVHVAPYFAMDGELVCQKVRTASKDFMVLKAHDGVPAINDCQLFGRPVWGDKNDKRVVVTEGEIDAMSCAQATGFEYPCVSVSSGAKGAAKSLKSNYLWLDRFKEIVLWFDDDEPGHKARDECAPLFKVGKVKVAKA